MPSLADSQGMFKLFQFGWDGGAAGRVPVFPGLAPSPRI